MEEDVFKREAEKMNQDSPGKNAIEGPGRAVDSS